MADIIQISTSNNYKCFQSNWSNATSISAWLKLPAKEQATIAKVIYADNTTSINDNGLTEIIEVYNNSIYFRSLNFEYMAGKWGFFLASINYTKGEICFYYGGRNGINFQYKSDKVDLNLINQAKIVHQVYIGGNETSFCSCALSRVYFFINQYTFNVGHSIATYVGGDLDLYVWYYFNQAQTITDISGNQRNPEINENDIEYHSQEEFIKIQNASLIIRNNSEWFTPSFPSLSITFQCKFTSNFTNQVPILKRISNQNDTLLSINLLINSGNLNAFSVTFNQTNTNNSLGISKNLADGSWHFCSLYITCVKGNSQAYILGLLDINLTSWIMNNQNGYTDANSDIIMIGGPGSSDFWLLKDFRIYQGAFRFGSIPNCLIVLGANSKCGPDFNVRQASLSTCTYCNDTYSVYINSSTLIATCQIKQNVTSILICQGAEYYDSIFNICRSCKTGCKTCKDTSNNCLSCDSGYYLINNSCELDCIAPSYKNPLNNTCSFCDKCQTCENYFNNCSSCYDGYYLNNTSYTCDICSKNCTKCVTVDYNCIECISSTDPVYILGSNLSNPEYQYCRPCLNLFNNCTSCYDGYYLNSRSKICDKCSTNCTKCIGIDYNCTECISSTDLIYELDANLSNPEYQYCKPDIRFTQGYLEVSQFNTLDIYLTFNFSLYSNKIPDLNKLLKLEISNLNGDDYSYDINQTSNINITFRLNPNQIIDHNVLTVIIQDSSFILDSNNRSILTKINNITLGVYYPSTKTSLSTKVMAIIGSAIIGISLPMVASGGLSALWGFIDVLQYLFYFIYLDMKLPINFEKILIFFKICTLPLPNIPVIFMDNLEEHWNITLPKLKAPERFDDFDIDAMFLRTGLVYLFYIIASFVFVKVIIGLEKIFYRLTGSNYGKIIIRNVKWKFPLRYILLNIIQLSFAIFLQFTNLLMDEAFHITSNIIAILSCLFLLFFIIWVIKQTNSKLFNDKRLVFNTLYGTLTEEFVESNTKYILFIIRNQSIIQIIRKILYIFGFVILYDYVMINLISIMIQSLIMIGILAKYLPYVRKSFNIKNIIQEIIVMFISLLLLINQNIILSDIILEIIDYILVLLVLICCCYNLLFIIIDEFKVIKKYMILIRNYCKKCNNKTKKRLAKNHFQILPNISAHIDDITNISYYNNNTISALNNSNTIVNL